MIRSHIRSFIHQVLTYHLLLTQYRKKLQCHVIRTLIKVARLSQELERVLTAHCLGHGKRLSGDSLRPELQKSQGSLPGHSLPVLCLEGGHTYVCLQM